MRMNELNSRAMNASTRTISLTVSNRAISRRQNGSYSDKCKLHCDTHAYASNNENADPFDHVRDSCDTAQICKTYDCNRLANDDQ
jgi:hypothetical protein